MSAQRRLRQARSKGFTAGCFSAVLAAILWALSITVGVNTAIAGCAGFILAIMGIVAIIAAAHVWHSGRRLALPAVPSGSPRIAGLGMVGLVLGSLAVLQAMDDVREKMDRSQ